MKRIALAFGTVAMGLSSALYAQVPSPQQGNVNESQPVAPNAAPQGGQVPSPGLTAGRVVPPPPVPVAPGVNRSSSRGYSLYGGPEESRSQYPERRGTQSQQLGPLYKIPGVPDEITTEDQAREARRNAAVEFGMFRNQFTGSTQFWMDHDRTRLAKVRYAMDEQMFRSIHPDYDWGDGGYMYNTAASVGGPQWPGSSNRVIVTPPQGEPTVRHNLNTASLNRLNTAPVAPARTVQPAPINRSTSDSRPLVASDRGE
jgi:hypothetical protein